MSSLFCQGFAGKTEAKAYSLKLPAYSGAFLLAVDNFSFFAYSWSFFAYSFSFFTYSWSFFAYSGKVRLIRALRDCKQRSLTVSKKAPAVNKKNPPIVSARLLSGLWFSKCVPASRTVHDIVASELLRGHLGLEETQTKGPHSP